MKPTKNRVYCPACHRSKMVFESKENALNFIKFNASEIMEENGYAPKRAYFCVSCGAWHVTHQDIDPVSIDKKLGPVDEDVTKRLSLLTTYSEQNMFKQFYDCAVNVHYGIKGMQKLADYLMTEKYSSLAMKYAEKLYSLMMNTVDAAVKKAEECVAEEDFHMAINMYVHAIKIGNSARGIIPKNDERNAQMKMKVSDYVEKRRELADMYFIDKPVQSEMRIANKIAEYVDSIHKHINEGEFVYASKQIHFAVIYLNKHENTVKRCKSIGEYINKLLDYKKMIPDWASEKREGTAEETA